MRVLSAIIAIMDFSLFFLPREKYSYYYERKNERTLAKY